MSKHTLGYWNRKFKLWVILHGGIKNYKQKAICKSCKHYVDKKRGYSLIWVKCNLRLLKEKRMMIKRDFTKIENSHRLFSKTWHCAEWIKHV